MAESDHPAPCGPDPSTADTARRWATESCAAQGLPVKITARAVLAVVVIQLSAGRGAQQPAA